MREKQLDRRPEIRPGFCACGCGGRTRIANRSFSRLGVRKGEPMAFISGHNSRGLGLDWEVEARGFVSDCWIWKRSVESNGYGRKVVNGAKQGAHRWVFETIGKQQIPNGFHLHHLCGVRSCVNPEHLQPISPSEHLRLERGKLTLAEVDQIKRSLASFAGWGACSALASRFGVSSKTINDIKLGKTWGDI